MAVEPGLVVPKQISMEAIMADLKDTIEKLGGESLDKTKAKRDEKEKALERKANNKAIQYYESQKEVESGTKNDPVYQYLKRIFPQKHQKKLNKMYDKYLIKNKYYQYSLRAFNTMVSLLKDNAGWFLKLLGFLALLAVFDPNGEFITSIINTLTDMFLWLIDIIIPMLPGIIDRMITLVPKIVNALIPAIEKIVSTIGKGLITAGQEQGGISGMFLQIAGYLTPVIAALGFAAKLFGGLGPVFGFIWDVLSALKPVLGWILSALGAIVSAIAAVVGLPAWLVAAIIAAVVAIGVFIYKYWDELPQMFANLGNIIYSFFTETLPPLLVKGLKFLGKALVTLFIAPWLALFAFIKYVVPAIFGFIKMLGKGILKAIIFYFTEVVPTVLEYIWDFIKAVPSLLRKGFVVLYRFLKELPSKIANFFSIENILKLMNKGYDGFIKFIDDIWKVIKSPFTWLADYIAGVMGYISSFGKQSIEKGRAISAISRTTNMSQDRLKQVFEDKRGLKAALTKEEKATLESENIDLTEFSEILKTTFKGKDAEIEKLLTQQLAIMQQSEPSGSSNLSSKEKIK